MAVAQVGDAAAAQLAQAGKRPAVRRAAQQHIHPVARTLQRCAMVRRAQEDDAAQLRQPAVPGLGAVVAGAARHQPAHAVHQHAELLHRDGPGSQQRLDLAGQRTPVERGVQAAVVAHIDRGVAQRPRQVFAVVVAGALPLQVVHAQAVHQQQHLAGGCTRGLQRRQVKRAAPLAQRHRHGQRVAVGSQAVTHHAIEGRQHGLALGQWRGVRSAQRALQEGFEPQQRGLQPGIDQACHAVDTAVDHAGEPARTARLGRAGQAHGAEHRLVHALDDARHASRGLGGQTRRAAQIAGTQLPQWVRRGLVRPGRGRCGHGVLRNRKGSPVWHARASGPCRAAWL